jgi:hypothetical protein
MAFDQLLERAFGKSSKLSNIAITCGFASFLAMTALFPVYRATGAVWASRAGIGCFALAVVFCAAAFSAQTVSQVIRLLLSFYAKARGTKPNTLKEDDPLYAKLIKKAFRITKAKGSDSFRPLKISTVSRVSRSNVRLRARRAYRRAPRPAFAHPSGGGGSGDSSGDSDSGDPPGPSNHTTPLTLSKPFYRKSNSPSHRRRFLCASRCWRVSCGKRSDRRWVA